MSFFRYSGVLTIYPAARASRRWALEEVFRSVEACEARVEETLASRTDLSYPMISAVCEPAASEPLVAALDLPAPELR